MPRIALINQKGGVGKTTTAVNLPAAMAELGRSVLVIDLDPQANLTVGLGITPRDVKKSTYDVLLGRAKASQAILPIRKNLHVLPATLDLSGAEVELVSMMGREYVLAEAMKDVPADRYQYIFIDCPPSLGLLNVAALTYASHVLVPIQCEFYALQGVSMLLKTIQMVKQRLNPALEIAGVLACMYDVRRGLAADVLGEIDRHFKNRLFKTKIRNTVKLAEAPSHGQSILEYAPDCAGAEDYRRAARETVALFETIEIPMPVAGQEPTRVNEQGERVFSLAEKIRRTHRSRHIAKSTTLNKRGRKKKIVPAPVAAATPVKVAPEKAAMQKLEQAIDKMPADAFHAAAPANTKPRLETEPSEKPRKPAEPAPEPVAAAPAVQNAVANVKALLHQRKKPV